MADVLFLEYPKCSTCKKAKAWLDAHGVAYADRHIVEVGEPMDHVAARFLLQGMSPEQVAERTMFPLEIVLKIQKAIAE